MNASTGYVAVVARAGGRCERCQGPLLPQGRRSYGFEVHHIQRRVDGGGDEAENLLVLCLGCHDEERRQDARDGKVGWKGVKRYPKRLPIPENDRGMELLQAIAEEWDTTHAEVIRRLIREKAKELGLSDGAE